MFTCNVMLPGMGGDLGIAWEADKTNEVAAKFQVLIDSKEAEFFIVEKKKKLARTKTTARLVKGGTALLAELEGSNRKVYIRNAHIQALINSGITSLVSLEGVDEIVAIRKCKDGMEAAQNNTIAQSPSGGG